MTIVKTYEDAYPQISDSNLHYFTEMAIAYALLENGLVYNNDFEFHHIIEGIPFNKSRKHEVDLKLKSKNGDELFVEIKGQMTYLEVNKLLYLHKWFSNFYILQLTEIDWKTPYDENSNVSKFMKFKQDFEEQISELVEFFHGRIKGTTLSRRSKKRLKDYIKYRRTDLKRWEALASQTNQNGTHN